MLDFRNIIAGKLRSLVDDRQSIIPPRRKSTSNVGRGSETLKMVARGKIRTNYRHPRAGCSLLGVEYR
jgi:hypothetical protein